MLHPTGSGNPNQEPTKGSKGEEGSIVAAGCSHTSVSQQTDEGHNAHVQVHLLTNVSRLVHPYAQLLYN
jgi:hypothetical protein